MHKSHQSCVADVGGGSRVVDLGFIWAVGRVLFSNPTVRLLLAVAVVKLVESVDSVEPAEKDLALAFECSRRHHWVCLPL